MIRCKDCCWYEKAHVLLSDGTTRDYTENDVDDLGINNSVSADVGINVGGRCKYYAYNNTCWMEEDDFCSKGQTLPYEHDNKWNEQLKEQKSKKPHKLIPYDMDIGFEVIHTQRGFCSSCGQSVIEEKHDFCPRCGQAIKWD